MNALLGLKTRLKLAKTIVLCPQLIVDETIGGDIVGFQANPTTDLATWNQVASRYSQGKAICALIDGDAGLFQPDALIVSTPEHVERPHEWALLGVIISNIEQLNRPETSSFDFLILSDNVLAQNPHLGEDTIWFALSDDPAGALAFGATRLALAYSPRRPNESLAYINNWQRRLGELWSQSAQLSQDSIKSFSL